MRTRRLWLWIVILLLSGCATGASEGAWKPISPGGGGWVMCVDAGPTGIIIVCSDVSGAYRSLDRGRSWDVIGSYRGLDYTHVNAVGFDPLDSSCKCNRRISKEHLVRRSKAKAFSGAQV